MVTSQSLYLLFLCGIVLERVGELVLSRRNVARALARGGVETGREDFPLMALVHSLFLVSCGAEVLWLGRSFPGTIGWLAFAFALLAQGLRYWAISTLGERWNVRIVLVPGDPPIASGPYRYIRHPNYLAVVVEFAAIPAIHGAWLTALLFSLANAAVLRTRIRAEETALGPQYRAAFAGRPRFLPRGTQP